MRDKSFGAALNQHLNNELYSAYLYLAMAAYFEATSFPGFAHWMKQQAKEEYQHAMKFWDFIYDTGGSVNLLAVAEPKAAYASPLAAFRDALEHEREVTRAIHSLYERALRDKDYPAQVFLQWFINEQVEEEKTAGAIVDSLTKLGDSSASILLFDRELGSRGAA